MKKILLMVLAGVLTTPFFVSAQAVTDQFTSDTQVQNACLDLHYNMAYRSRDTQTNGEVSDLQDFLVTNGYLSGDPTGYFGVATLAAVKKFQSAVGLGNPATPGYGSVGPKSRAKIKGMTCGDYTPPASASTSNTNTTTIVTTNSDANSNLPAGCKSEAGFSFLTGVRCAAPSTQSTTSIYPAGCTSSVGFSSTTGQACSVSVPQVNTPKPTLAPSITITQPVHGMYKTGSLITVGWNENYAASAITATVMNAVTGNQSYSTVLGPGTLGNNFANIPTLISSNLLPARYTLSVCDMNTPNPTVSFKPLCSSTQFIILPTTVVMTNLPSGCSVNASWDETLDRACFGGTTTVTSSNTLVNAVDSSVLKIVYSSTTGEAGLTAIFSNVSITAGPNDFKIYKYGAFDTATYAFMATLNNARGANGATTNPTYYKVSGSATDNGTYWVIPAGQTASFSLSADLSNPKALFAGSYNATLSLYKPSGIADSVAPSLVGHIITPYVSVVGETSPYITSVSASLGGTSPTYAINGIRFEYTSNSVTMNGVTRVLPSADTRTINFTPSDFGITSTGSYMIQVTSPIQGASNKAYALISNPGSTSVAPKVSSVSIIGAQTSYSAGALIKFSVKGVATNGTLVNPSQNFNVQSSMRMLDPIQTYLPVYINGVVQAFNASYNQSTGYWDVTMTAPSDTTKTYDVDTAVYCANTASGCQSGQVNTGFRFNVTAAVATPVAAIKVSIPAASVSYNIGKPGGPINVAWEEVGFTPQSMQVMLNGTTSGFASIVLANLGASTQTSLSGVIPNVPAGNYTVSVCDNGTPSPIASGKPLCGTSAQFGITPSVTTPSIAITSPNGGETLTVGQTKRITWDSSSVIDKVYLGYSFGVGSLNWIATNIPNTGYYDWNVNIGNTTNTQVKISIIGYQTGTGSWSDQSDNFFTVNPAVNTPVPTVTFTASPTSIISGQTSTLSWSSTNATSCTSSGDGSSWGWPSARYITGAQYTPALTATQTFTMSCTGAGGTTSKSVTVTVAAAATPLTVVTPNGGEMLTSGQTYGISWTGGDSAVDVYLLDDPSRLGKKIFSGIANNGSASWVVTPLTSADLLNPTTGTYGTPSGKYVIWVGCTDNKCTVDNSNSSFSIISSMASTTTASVQSSNQLASVIGAFSTDPTPTPSAVAKWTYSWVNNLEIGSTYTNDVSALQTALTKEGVYTGEITGGFYSQTYLAVKALQTKYGIESTGFVGSETRAKLNELFGVSR